ncbi:hypothetical protein FMM05_00480 [Flavobacterium zepuense]|uniref:Outer membrane protein beta-barrel domain-containing protein n=1 Tax=Flavobacterium zepuense TaxID=2593302 RepID=A0A552VB46_9FLAO|nr:hypothetical protein FMM05_00480 [Flavobacterium zepuense]
MSVNDSIERTKQYRSVWDSFIPKYVKLQYAGGMGFLAIGSGWDYGNKKQWESDFLIGWLPRYTGKQSQLVFTIKQNYIPWSLHINGKVILRPLHTGLYITSTMGRDYWIKEPDSYPDSYYGFSTRLRINAFIGQQLTFLFRQEKPLLAKSITCYYEISSNDLYIVSAVTNSYLQPQDYLKLSLGVKVQLL